jgi:hypothetical protein
MVRNGERGLGAGVQQLEAHLLAGGDEFVLA